MILKFFFEKIESQLAKLIAIAFSVFVLLFLQSCSDKSEQQIKKFVVPVTVDKAVKKPVPVQIRAIGNVEAYSTVSIKSRVGGELADVHFREGQDVAKGDLLFTIDPKPFETALNAAQANLSRDTALARKAEDDLRRYTELLAQELVSRSQYEQIFANAEALKATVESDKAIVENARLQLSYCRLYAPISGRTGSLLVNKGNVIRANDDKPMVVINQIQPIYVSFSVPEQNIPEIKMRMKSGNLLVEAFLSNDDKNPLHGVLTFIDNTVDKATGTIKLKATFDNKERRLWPGQFVTVKITLFTIQNAVVVPSQAVLTGQQGKFVFVVKDSTAELRPVTTGSTYGEITVIENGLAPDETVVTDGQMLLMPGASVAIRNLQDQENNIQTEPSKTQIPTQDNTK